MSMFRLSHRLLNQQVEQAAAKQINFTIQRTASRNIPVYMKYTGGARRVPMTEVRKFSGDVSQLQNELQRLVGSHVNVVRGQNSLFITGNYVTKVKNHLQALGF